MAETTIWTNGQLDPANDDGEFDDQYVTVHVCKEVEPVQDYSQELNFFYIDTLGVGIPAAGGTFGPITISDVQVRKQWLPGESYPEQEWLIVEFDVTVKTFEREDSYYITPHFLANGTTHYINSVIISPSGELLTSNDDGIIDIPTKSYYFSHVFGIEESEYWAGNGFYMTFFGNNLSNSTTSVEITGNGYYTTWEHWFFWITTYETYIDPSTQYRMLRVAGRINVHGNPFTSIVGVYAHEGTTLNTEYYSSEFTLAELD